MQSPPTQILSSEDLRAHLGDAEWYCSVCQCLCCPCKSSCCPNEDEEAHGNGIELTMKNGNPSFPY